ncbi:MAG: SH3 domain-containing protein [Ruminococcus sp.]|jgi:uncharacterized protein YgiM (DUF1202 family)/predicted nucleic acid-binding Zn ribbon protein
MKKCPRCGQIGPDENTYCENCGTYLPENPQQSGKRNILLILVGCCAAAAVIIAAALFYTSMNSKNESDPSVQTADIKPEDPVLTPEVSPSPAAVTPEATAAPQEAAEEEPEPTQISYETYYVVNCQESITLRNSPSTAGGEICQIPFGSAVSYVASAKNGFYEIIYNGKTGYALAAYLDVEPQAEPPVQAPSNTDTYPTYYVVNCRESITLRKSPGTGSSEICQIPLGAAVSFVENAGNGFYEIIYNGKTGYALASYLSLEQSSDSAAYLQVVNCQESITLRKAPSTSADSFCQIPLGATVKYLESSENGFCMVSYNGYTGYVLVSYLSVQ